MNEEEPRSLEIDLLTVASFSTLILLTLKILGVVTWGWTWIFLPFLLWASVIVVAFTVLLTKEIRRDWKKDERHL